MVLDNKTLKPLHELTENGKVLYQEYLEFCADEILYRKKHPIKYFFEKLFNYIKGK